LIEIHANGWKKWFYNRVPEMDEINSRMTEKKRAPSGQDVARWVGDSAFLYWGEITRMIESSYPGIFVPEWLFAGKKHGWSLRYKKGRSFCTLIPERGCLRILIVFGAKERDKVKDLISELSSPVVEAYNGAVTYHDGKWLLLAVDSPAVLNDIRLLLSVKRKPRK